MPSRREGVENKRVQTRIITKSLRLIQYVRTLCMDEFVVHLTSHVTSLTNPLTCECHHLTAHIFLRFYDQGGSHWTLGFWMIAWWGWMHPTNATCGLSLLVKLSEFWAFDSIELSGCFMWSGLRFKGNPHVQNAKVKIFFLCLLMRPKCICNIKRVLKFCDALEIYSKFYHVTSKHFLITRWENAYICSGSESFTLLEDGNESIRSLTFLVQSRRLNKKSFCV